MGPIVVAGHICLDIIPRFYAGADLQPGRLTEVGPADLATGGCVANVGRALARLGVPVRLAGKIGDDPFGQIVADLLRNDAPALADGMVVRPGGVTSYSVVINPSGQDRSFLHMPGENATFTANDVDDQLLDGAAILHFGYPPLMAAMAADEGEELVRLFSRVKGRVATSLDLSLPDPQSPSGRLPWRRILERVLPLTDYFFPSEEELAFMLGVTANATELAETCIAMGAGVVVVKRGERGLLARTAAPARLQEIPYFVTSGWSDASRDQACFQANVVGTTGSGDATIAGFLMALRNGGSLEDCLRAGCAIGAFSVEAADATSGIRPWATVRARIEAGWETLEAI